MINKKHVDDLKGIVGGLIDEIVIVQSAVNHDLVGPEEIRDLYAALTYASHQISGIMYGASIEITGAYMQDEDE